MGLEKQRTEQLKQLQIFDELKQDPLFLKLVQVCRNDKKYSKENYCRGYYDLSNEDTLTVVGHLLPYAIFMLFCLLYVKIGLPFWTYRVAFFIASLCSAGMSVLFAGGEKSWLKFSSVINFVLSVALYILVRFLDFPMLITVLIGVCVQFALRLIGLFDLKRKDAKLAKDSLQEDYKRAEEIAQYERFYTAVRKDADERIAICSEELLRRGIQPAFHDRRFWWRNHELVKSDNLTLFHSGKLLDDPHIARYKSEQTFDEYDYRGEVVGKTHHEYALTVDKRFFEAQFPKGDHRHILQHMKEFNFQCLGNPSVDLSLLDHYEIRAIGCKWTIFEKTDTERVMHHTPTDREIEQARAEIEDSRNADERVYNAVTKGVALTMDELFYATGGRTSVDEQMYASSRKANDLDKFVRNNTYDDVSRSRYKHQRGDKAVFMYVIGSDVYFSTEVPHARVSDAYEYDGGRNEISSRNEEIEAALYYLLCNDIDLMKHLIGAILGGQENEYQEQLASKVFHTVACATDYFDRHFK